jgi:hypothetical protein
MDYHAVINFADRSITLKINGEYNEVGFIGLKETPDKLGIEESSSDNTRQQNFRTRRVCVSNVTFHDEFKYAI